MATNQAELTTEQVLKRDIPWETYMTTKLITGTCLQLLRRYDKRSESYRATLLDDDGPAYIRVFVNILRDILKEETVEYVLALIDEMLTGNPKWAKLFHDKSLANEDTYEPFLSYVVYSKPSKYFKFCCLILFRFIHCMMYINVLGLGYYDTYSSGPPGDKSGLTIGDDDCSRKITGSYKRKAARYCLCARSKTHSAVIANGEASNSKSKITNIEDVLIGVVEWLCAQLKNPSHPTRGIPTAISCLATLLKEPSVRSSFVKKDGVKLLIPLISPASTQQSIQLLYETCLCVWLLSYYEPAVEYLATSRALPQLVDVIKGSTKEKVVRVVVLTLRNLLPKGTFGAQMVPLGLPQIVQNLKAQAWSDEDLLEALNQLEEGLKDNIKKLSSFDKYKQEVLLGHLDWSPMHKDPFFWRENITNFEENDFQILRVLVTILDTSGDPRTLAVACYDLSQFIQYHPAGRLIVNDLKAKERVMRLMNHENAELKNPSHPTRGIPTAISCLATLLKEPSVRSSFVKKDGVKLLIPLISPASTQQSIQLLYETCLCVWLLSYYEPAVEYLATSRALPQLVDVIKGSTKEKVVRVVVLTLRNLLPKGTFGAQMVPLGLPQIVQNLKAQAWSDEEVLLGHLDWSPMHKDPFFWRENITNFEENDFQILRVLVTILDTSGDPRTLAVACYDLSQFIQYHPAGRLIVNDLKAKERVMRLMNHENAEVTKNALLCIQRLFLGAKYASFLQ
ncbi:hypothetical protein GIB67_043255 [Kingdonia uniflora]|uniref:Vacuolar proton pump subunit H n=1 Tax=Kingdonia uniflora TaxID=39325 RepID=A0A7J7NJZ8_9MAGN|nr:hypothetical protein GIB67_043255 [Kingdonia uniflora]